MADALCGPSSALSSFQKHTQVDRTLQQDRLTGPRHSPAQGFRSFDPRTGSLDADFHAFENASNNSFQLEQPLWRSDPTPVFAAPATPNWASDFQNLRIANSSMSANQLSTAAPIVKSSHGGWQQDFINQSHNAVPVAQQKRPETAYGATQGYTPFLGGPVYQPQPLQTLGQPASVLAAETARFNEADFDKVFQSVYDEIETETLQTLTNENVLETTERMDETDAENMIYEPSQTRIGSDAIEYTETRDRTVEQDSHDANELARVAGQLVQNISHESDQKFKNSNFLDLMRRIRDKEVEIRNNDFEPTRQAEPMVELQQNQQRPEDQTSFQFPDLDEVYRPLPPSGWENGVFPERPIGDNVNPIAWNQISELHPGGPLYPEQSPPRPGYAQMSGAIDSSKARDESSGQYGLA